MKKKKGMTMDGRTRKIFLTWVSVSVVCLLISLVSIIMALKIRYQSEQTATSARMIHEQSELLAGRYRELSDRIAEAHAREALSFLEEGDRMLGLTEAVMAYESWSPDYIYDDIDDDIYEETILNGMTAQEDCPSQLTYALTELLYLYENGARMKPDRILKDDSTIRYMKISPEGSRLMTVGEAGSLSVWESQDDSITMSVRPKGADLSWESRADFLSETQILYPQDDGLCLQDIGTKEIITYPCDGYEGVISIPGKASFLVVEEAGCYLAGADGKTSGRLRWDQLQEGLGVMPGFKAAQTVTGEGRILAALELTGIVSEEDATADTAVSVGNVPGRERKWIVVLEYDSAGGGEPSASLYPIDYEEIGSICLEADSGQQGSDLLYVAGNHREQEAVSVTTGKRAGRLQAFDLSGQTELWYYDVPDGWFYDVEAAHRRDSSYLLCQMYSDVRLLDKSNGSLLHTFSFDSEVVMTGAGRDSDDFMAFTRDGRRYNLHTGRMEDIPDMTFVDSTSSNVKDFAIGADFCVMLPYGSDCVTIYRMARGAGVELFHEGEGAYRQAGLNADGRFLAAVRDDGNSQTCVEMFDTAKKELLWTYEDDGEYAAMVFGDFRGDQTETLLLITREAYHMIGLADGTVISTVAFDGGGLDYLGMDRAGGVVCLQDSHTLYGYRISDGVLLYEEELEDGIAAVCHERPFYAVVSKETDSLLFYQMGEAGVFMDPLRTGIDVDYLETIFFDENDDDLYLVYRDGSVVVFFVDWDTNEDVHFCGAHGSYEGLSEKMIRYEAVEGVDFGFLCGENDAYQINLRKGQMYRKLSHIHGYLAYDAVSGTLYLHNGKEIYTSALYSTAEMVELAQQILSESSYYWNYREFVPYYLDEI